MSPLYSLYRHVLQYLQSSWIKTFKNALLYFPFWSYSFIDRLLHRVSQNEKYHGHSQFLPLLLLIHYWCRLTWCTQTLLKVSTIFRQNVYHHCLIWTRSKQLWIFWTQFSSWFVITPLPSLCSNVHIITTLISYVWIQMIWKKSERKLDNPLN